MFSLLMFILISAGGIFAAAFFKSKYEETLPITIMSIVFFLFIFGMLGILKAGFYFVLITLLLLTALSIIHIILHKRFFEFIKSFFTPAFFVFAVLFFAIVFFNKGKVASSWDEFSHWVDSVKAMFILDDFVTNPKSYSLFKSYPPAMALFQYFFTKFNALLWHNAVFVEEKVYIAYQVFCVSLLVPFFGEFKKIGRLIFSVTAIVCSTFLFYPNILAVSVIDPFLSVLGASAFSTLILNEKLKKSSIIQIVLICFTLVLAKDAGLYIASFICICSIIRIISGTEFKMLTKKQIIKNTAACFLPVFATALAKILWKTKIRVSGAYVSGGKTGIISYTKMFFLRNDTTYKQEVVEKFKTTFFENRVTIGDFDLKISYFNLTVLFSLLIFIIGYLYIKNSDNKKSKIATGIICATVVLQSLFYIYSLGAIYISNFSEYEAKILASYNRYMDIVFRMLFIIIVITLVNYFGKVKINAVAFAAIFAAVLILMPAGNVSEYVRKHYVSNSIVVRSKYIDITEDINNSCKPGSKIYFISQEDKGFDFHVTRFSVRPYIIDNHWGWSISNDGPFFEGDIWTKELSVEKFKETLINDEYDYVAIYKTNDYFNDYYGSLFENPQDIEENSVFEFDRQNNVLKRVDTK